MPYKLVAAAIIISLSFFIAYLIRKKFIMKLELYRAFIDFIEYIKNEISYFCTPTACIIDSYDNDVLEQMSFLTMIESGDWSNAVNESGIKEYIDDETRRILISFSKKLGRSTVEEQIVNCEYTGEALNKKMNEIKKDVTTKSKAYASVSILMGLMLSILIL